MKASRSATRASCIPRSRNGEIGWPLSTSRTRYLVVRAASNAPALIPQVQRVLRELDPNVPLARVATIDELVDRSLEQPRGLSWLVAALAAVALTLSIVGI
jgi:hypothetical protein